MSAAQTKGHAFELIPLQIETKGEVLASNIVEFREMVRTALETINRDPRTDEEFGEAKANVKTLKDAEDSIARAIKEMDKGNVAKLKESLEEAGEEIRRARLDLDKLVKAKEAEVRAKHLADALDDIEWDAPVSQRDRMFRGELEAAIKGKRTLGSLTKGLSTTVAIINGRLAKSKAILDEFEGVHGRELILDRQGLETKTPDQVEAELRHRLDVKRAEDEKRKAQEEAAKAKAEAEAVKAEAHGKTALVDAEPAAAKQPDPTPAQVASPKPEAEPDTEQVAAEWKVFSDAFMAAFGPVREAKAKLACPVNIERANRLASGINSVWTSIKEEVMS